MRLGTLMVAACLLGASPLLVQTDSAAVEAAKEAAAGWLSLPDLGGTAVSNGRTVQETVVPMKDTDGRWRVSGYFVRPE